MAALSENNRKDLWAEFMRELSRLNEHCATTKPDLRAAVDAVDDWVDANFAAYVAALPVNWSGQSTREQAQLPADISRIRADTLPPTPLGGNFGGMNVSKVFAGYVAADTWLTSVNTAYNQSIPQPARGDLNNKQKALLLYFVVDQRFKVS